MIQFAHGKSCGKRPSRRYRRSESGVDCGRAQADEAVSRLSIVNHELATERAERSDDRALIAHLKLVIAKMNREKFGPRSEKSERLLNQLELHLEDLEATATEDELAAEKAAQATTSVKAFARKKRRANRFPNICRASGWWFRGQRHAPAAESRG